MARKYITEFKGDYRVQYWGPRNEDGTKNHNVYYFDDEVDAKAKYMELVMRQVLRSAKYNRVVYERLWDFGGEDMLAFVVEFDSRKGY